jgi:heme/copper-type cytochrome/quinol oxidase subunit 2
MMHNLLQINLGLNDMLYALPLIVVVSLVYSATRHEEAGPIFAHALRTGLWITGFMAVVFAVLLVMSWQL